MTIGVGGSLVSFAGVDVPLLMLSDAFVLLNRVIFKAASSFSKLPAEPDTLELSSAIGTMGIGSVITIGFDCEGSTACFGASSVSGWAASVTVGVVEGTVAGCCGVTTGAVGAGGGC